jgi:hypothetical protein
MSSPPLSRTMLDMNTEQSLASYLICLRGKLDLEQASWFPELVQAEDKHGNTLLIGELPDQAALMGILFRAHNLNLQILSVELQKETRNK